MESQVTHAVKGNAMSRPKIFDKIANRLPCLILISAAMLSICSYATTAAANEVMTDRCSAEVAITPTYNDKPNTPNTVILTRGSNGQGSWSQPFRVSLDSSGHVRWWCHSTTGNFFDPGTWRLGDANAIKSCIGRIITIASNDKEVVTGSLADCYLGFKPGGSAVEGWTPERSRCGNHSRLIRARLGPNRLLQIECLGR